MASRPLEVSLAIREVGAADGIAVVRPVGDIDLANVDELAASLASPRCREAAAVVLDLTAVPFMDSSGIAALLNAANQLGSRLAVVIDPGSAVARLFELTGVAARLSICTTEAEALAHLAAAGPDGDS